MAEIAMKVFGTSDYEAMLEILPPYDGMVKEFNREVEKFKQTQKETQKGANYECNEIYC